MWIAAPLFCALTVAASDGQPSSLALAWVAEARGGPPRGLVASFVDLSEPGAPPPRRYAYAAQLWRGEQTDAVLRFAEPTGGAVAVGVRFEATPALEGFPERESLGLRWRSDDRIELRVGAERPWQLLTEALVLPEGPTADSSVCRLTATRATLRGPGELRRGLALVEVCDHGTPVVLLRPGAVLLVDEQGAGTLWWPDQAQVFALIPGQAPGAPGAGAQAQIVDRRPCQASWTPRVMRLVVDDSSLVLEPTLTQDPGSSLAVDSPRLGCSALLSGLRLDKNRVQGVNALVIPVDR